MTNILYVAKTAFDAKAHKMFHPVVVEAINNNGIFSEDFSDLLSLTNLGPINADGSNRWALDFVG